MNCSHNGANLGQVLYKICNRLQIVQKVGALPVPLLHAIFLHVFRYKVGHVTCDNAKNNDTMMKEFVRCYRINIGDDFDVKHRQIR